MKKYRPYIISELVIALMVIPLYWVIDVAMGQVVVIVAFAALTLINLKIMDSRFAKCDKDE